MVLQANAKKLADVYMIRPNRITWCRPKISNKVPNIIQPNENPNKDTVMVFLAEDIGGA